MRFRRMLALAAATSSIGMVATVGGPPGVHAAPPDSSALALLAGNVLVGFSTADPTTLTQTVPITGTLDGEVIVGFDIRPATGELVAVGMNGTSGHVYVVDAQSGVARPISPTPFATTLPGGGTWAVDFNPAVDRIRFVHSSGASYRLNPNNGTLAGTDSALAPSQPTAVAYDRSTAVAPAATTLFSIDAASSALGLVGGVDGMPSPNAGATSTRGALGVAVTSPAIGFDIAADGTAVATLQVGGAFGAYQADLAAGATTALGNVGDGTQPVLDLALERPAAGDLLALTDANALLRLNAGAPASAGTSVAITGLRAGEKVVGIDVRPATGEVIGVGVGGTTGRIYRIEPTTGAATAIGAEPFSDALPAGGTWSVDFNPTVDRIRLVHSGGASYRLNPANGALGGTDTPVGPAGANAVAYDRSIATTPATTLFAIDATAGTLELVGGPNGSPSPNLGDTSTRGPLGLALDSTVVALDITPVGEALASLKVGGSTGLYRVDLASGRARSIGQIGDGATTIIDLAAVPTLPAGAGQFVAVAPSRLIDTRTVGSKPAAGSTLDLRVAGVGGVPANATAVVVNLTGTEATDAGYLTLFATGQALPGSSNNNLTAGGTKANLAVVKVGAGGSISAFVDRGSHVVVDLVGYYAAPTSAAGRFTVMPGARVVDTRTTTPVPAGGSIDVTVAGTAGVPATGVSAVAVNITLTRAAGPGYAVAHATGQARPPTSSVNVDRAGGTASNLAIVPVGTDGKITLFSEAGSDVIVDVAGWFSDATGKGGFGGLFVPLDPSRVLDTRAGATPAPLARGASVDATVGGVAGVPAAGVAGVAVNVTAVDVVDPGFLTVFPTGAMWPLASNLNADASGATVPNLVMSPLGANGRITVFDDAGGHVLVDVSGWFTG